MRDGILMQTSRQLRTRAVLPDFIGNEYVLTFKARRTKGNEGFFSIMVYRRTRKRDIVSMWEDGVTASLISKIWRVR